MDQVLIDIGELRLLREHVLPLFGLDTKGPPADDAAVMELSGWHWDLVVTIDPCPEPIANMVLSDADRFFNIGWLTVVVNLSDVAAMGAQPVGIVVSTELPQLTPLRDAMRYFEGIKAAADRFDCPVLGGNVRERDHVLSTGTALGRVRKGSALTQGGGKQGDVVAVIGRAGCFWSSVLASAFGRDELGAVDLAWDEEDRGTWTAEEVARFRTSLVRPMPQIHTVPELVAYDLLTSGVDASDGVGESLRKVAERSRLQVRLDESVVHVIDGAVARVGDENGIDPRNLLMSWGGWEMVVTFPHDNYEKVERICSSAGEPLIVVGRLETGRPGAVVMDVDDTDHDVNLCGSEHFTKHSYMVHGLSSYVDLLRRPFVGSSVE